MPDEMIQQKKSIRKAKPYNDLLLVGLLTFMVLVMELTLLFFNRLFILNFFGILNDLIIFASIFLLINFIPHVKTKKIIFTIIFALFALLFFIDAIYSGFFSGFSSINSLKTLVNFKIESDLGVRVTLSAFVVLGESVVGFFLIWFLKLEKKPREQFLKITVSVFLAFVLGLTASNSIVFGLTSRKEYDSKIDYYTSNTFLHNHFYNSFKYVGKFGYVNFRIRDITFRGDNSVVMDDIKAYYDGKDTSYQNNLTGLLEGYNVINVLCESLDTRIVDQQLMPNFSSVMDRSLIFDKYYVPTYFQGATVNTEFMSMVSMYPVSAKSWVSSMGDQYKNNYFADHSLPGQLRQNGYETYYLHMFYESFYSRKKFMPNIGFETVKFAGDLPYNSNFYDIEMMDLLDYVDFSQKFYASLLTYSMHKGYDKRYATNDKNNPNYENYQFVKETYPDATKEIQVYYTKARMFDDFVGMLFDRLEQEKVLDKTIVLFYPDHYLYTSKGDLYKELGISIKDKEIHHQFLTMYLPEPAKQELLSRIDEDVWGAYDDYENAVSISLLASTIDLTPTLLNLLTKDSNYKYFSGQDIFADNNTVFFSDYTIFNGNAYFDIGRNVRYLHEPPSDPALKAQELAQLEAKLEDVIEQCMMSQLMLDIDYFRKISSLPELSG